MFKSLEEGMDVHAWFSLSYASYLVVARSVLQSMPMEWQVKFVALLNEAADTFLPLLLDRGRYNVNLRDPETGRFKRDPLADYERGRRIFARPKYNDDCDSHLRCLSGHHLHCPDCDAHLTSALLCPECGRRFDWLSDVPLKDW